MNVWGDLMRPDAGGHWSRADGGDADIGASAFLNQGFGQSVRIILKYSSAVMFSKALGACMLHPAELINTSICPHAAVKSLTAAVTDSFEVISQESVRILFHVIDIARQGNICVRYLGMPVFFPFKA